MNDTQKHHRLHQALALAVASPDRLDAVAADAGVAPECLLDILATEDGLRGARVRVAQMRESGELAKVRALVLLEKMLDRIDALIDEGGVGAAVSARLADTLFKVSGLAEERAVKLRTEAGLQEGPRPVVNIVFQGRPDQSVRVTPGAIEHVG